MSVVDWKSDMHCPAKTWAFDDPYKHTGTVYESLQAEIADLRKQLEEKDRAISTMRVFNSAHIERAEKAEAEVEELRERLKEYEDKFNSNKPAQME